MTVRQRVALTREVPSSISSCQLTHVSRTPIDVARARAQHEEYEAALRRAGALVQRLPEIAEFPDSVFVEDTAIALDDVAVLMRPGAPSRQGEVAHIEQDLEAHRMLRRIVAPATIDGGDVLVLGRTLWVGRSSRTNDEGIHQLQALVGMSGYDVRAAAMKDALHLKTAVTQVGERALLVNREWVDPAPFGDWEIIDVDPGEPFAANAVLLNGFVIHSIAFPRTQERLRAAGVEVLGVDASELAKAEGGVTCCSILL